MDSSILDSLGVELIGVISPVSICMLLVVLLISALSSPESATAVASSSATTAATLVYTEVSSDTPTRKLEGALLNAAVFVGLVAAVTFLLVILYYYRCTGFLKNYMRFSAFFVFASMGGSILLSVLQRLALPLDAPTAFLLLYNFAGVGVLSVLSPAVPIILRQGYLVALAVIVAAWFAKLPEWTTWTLLVALALYDLAAVLCPRGPLRILVELASSRDEELPALVYEARPAISSVSQAVAAIGGTGSVEFLDGDSVLPRATNTIAAFGGAGSVELQSVGSANSRSFNSNSADASSSSSPALSIIQIEKFDGEIMNTEDETLPLVSNEASDSSGSRQRPDNIPSRRDREREADRNQERHPSSSGSEIEIVEASRGIRLGLGDFVFYSVLVGRAAMYDLMTVCACYLAIISGLGCTLILLSVCRHALPALPISITLGVIFYFLTRLLMEPFVVGASTSMVMF